MRPCEEYEDLISAFLDGALAEPDRERLMAHMASCPACRSYFDDQAAIHGAFLRGGVSAPENFTSAVMDRVRAAPRRAGKKRILLRWQSYAALAACCALVALGVWRFQGHRPDTAREDAVESVDQSALVTASADGPEAGPRCAPAQAPAPEPDGAPALTDAASGAEEDAPALPEPCALPAAPAEQKNDAMDAQEEPVSLFETLPEVFLFSSGAGAWRTELHLNADGSFSGEYTDSNMGSGELLYCNFSGQFSEPVQVSEFVWSVTVESLELEDTPGEVTYVKAGNYNRIASTPYGLENAKEVLIYLPGAAAADLPEMFRNWTHAPSEGTLDFYGLYNVEEELGFSGYKS